MLFFYMRIILVILLLMSLSVHAAQWGKVSKDRALIYADKQMSAPIGFVSLGTKVRVGEVTRNKGQLLPITVNGKIAYIRVSDLELTQDSELLESATERLKTKATEKVFEQRFAISYNAHSSILATQKQINAMDSNSESLFFTGAGIKGYLINLKQKTTWTLGIDYMSASFKDKDYAMTFSTVSTQYAFNLVQTGPLNFHLLAGVNLIPFAQYSNNPDFKENGYGVGASVGAELIFKFNKVLALHVDGTYQYNKLFFPLNDTVKSSLGVDQFDPVISGLKLCAAISFNYY